MTFIGKTSSRKQIVSNFNAGHAVFLNVLAGHWVLMTGYYDYGYFVRDPNNNTVYFDQGTVINSATYRRGTKCKTSSAIVAAPEELLEMSN